MISGSDEANAIKNMTINYSKPFSGTSMHVLFIVPRIAAPSQYYDYPIGLAYVYAFLKRHGVSVSCLNLCHELQSTHVLIEKELTKRYVNVVCTGGMFAHWGLIEDILVCIKRIKQDVITVLGGPIVTADPELALTHLPIDYGVIGEGEYTLIELLEALQRRSQPATVKGLAFRRSDGKFVLTAKREEIKDLDALPIPEYQDFGFQVMMGNMKYAQQSTIFETFDEVRYAQVIGSRSCPFSCTFCYHPLGKKYRQRSLDHIFREIDYLTTTYSVNVIQFLDELFSADQQRMLAFVERIRPYGIRWIVQFRVSDVRLELLEEMVSSGLIQAGFGIESMNDKVLKSMKKHTTRSEIITALEAARQARLLCSGNIILGDPAETMATATESITWWKNNPIYNVTLGFILAVPDAPVYRYALEKGLIKNKYTHIRNMPLINLTKMSDAQYYALVLQVRWWNLLHTYVTPGTLIGTRRLEECYGDKYFYELLLRCPVCSGEQTYKKFMANHAPNVIIVCTHCFTSFKIPQKQAFPGTYSLFATIMYVLKILADAYALRFSFVRKHRYQLTKYRYVIKLIVDRFVRLQICMTCLQLFPVVIN